MYFIYSYYLQSPLYPCHRHCRTPRQTDASATWHQPTSARVQSQFACSSALCQLPSRAPSSQRKCVPQCPRRDGCLRGTLPFPPGPVRRPDAELYDLSWLPKTRNTRYHITLLVLYNTEHIRRNKFFAHEGSTRIAITNPDINVDVEAADEHL